jgi:hypothetical protein
MSLAREVNHKLEWEEDCCEPATMRNAIVEEAECYKDLKVSTATTTTSGYRVVGDKTLKNKQRLLDCLQECGVRPVSARRHIVTETTGAEKDSVTVTETEDVEMCDVSEISAQGDTVIKDTDRMFVRAMFRSG